MRQIAKGRSVFMAETSPCFRAPARRATRRNPPSAAAFWVAGAVLALLAGGCSDPKIVHVDSTEEFDHVVLEANKPVLVHFWKEGCALCGMLAPIMNTLSQEYDGRALVVGYRLMSLIFIARNQELVDRYNIVAYPTAILFVKGEERGRWVIHYETDDYRKALDAVCPPKPTTQPASASAP